MTADFWSLLPLRSWRVGIFTLPLNLGRLCLLGSKEYSTSHCMLPPKLGPKWPDRVLILGTLSYHVRSLTTLRPPCWSDHMQAFWLSPSWTIFQPSQLRQQIREWRSHVDPLAIPVLGYWVTPSPELPQPRPQTRWTEKNSPCSSLSKFLTHRIHEHNKPFQVPMFCGWWITQWETTGMEWKSPNSPLYEVGDLSRLVSVPFPSKCNMRLRRRDMPADFMSGRFWVRS